MPPGLHYSHDDHNYDYDDGDGKEYTNKRIIDIIERIIDIIDKIIDIIR